MDGRIRDLERALAARDRELHVTVLLDGDRVVAFTEPRVSRAENAVAFTDETAVIPAYRGRGLAKRLKAASLRDLAVRRPDVRLVTTTNEATNAPMLAVNRAGLHPRRDAHAGAAGSASPALKPNAKLTHVLIRSEGYS